MSLVQACSVSELPGPGEVLGVEVKDEPVIIVRDHEGTLHALNDICSHQYVKMSEGEDVVEGCELECWLHAARFDLNTGEAKTLPATDRVDVYPITIDGDGVLVDVDNPKNV